MKLRRVLLKPINYFLEHEELKFFICRFTPYYFRFLGLFVVVFLKIPLFEAEEEGKIEERALDFILN
jgi:hypothetical protein